MSHPPALACEHCGFAHERGTGGRLRIGADGVRLCPACRDRLVPEIPTSATCGMCGEVKPAAAFYTHVRSGLSVAKCRSCDPERLAAAIRYLTEGGVEHDG